MDLGKRHEFLRLHRKDVIRNMSNTDDLEEKEIFLEQLDKINREMADIKIAYLKK